MKWLRPALRFLLLGGLLFGAVRLSEALPGFADEKAVVVLDAARLSSLRADAKSLLGREPDDEEWGRMVRQAADEEMLVQEAIRRGWHRRDFLVRRRLRQNMRFVTRGGDVGPVDGAAALEQAYALGMPQRDPVVRQRLLQLMRRALQRDAELPEITPAQVADYARAHSHAMALPLRLRFSHVFRSGPQAQAQLRQLAGQNPSPAAAAALGEPFLLGADYGPASKTQIARDFGVAFAEQVVLLEPGKWSQPIASAYGTHLVWVTKVLPARPATDAYSLERAEIALSSSAEKQALAAGLEDLRSRYRFRIAGGGG